LVRVKCVQAGTDFRVQIQIEVGFPCLELVQLVLHVHDFFAQVNQFVEQLFALFLRHVDHVYVCLLVVANVEGVEERRLAIVYSDGDWDQIEKLPKIIPKWRPLLFYLLEK
jgi:hypothetical protein